MRKRKHRGIDLHNSWLDLVHGQRRRGVQPAEPRTPTKSDPVDWVKRPFPHRHYWHERRAPIAESIPVPQGLRKRPRGGRGDVELFADRDRWEV